MADLERKPPQSVREYVKNMGESFRQLIWVFTEFADRKVVVTALALLGLMTATTASSYLVPWFSGRMLDGIAKRDLQMVWFAVAGSVVLTLLNYFIGLLQCWRQLRFDALMSQTVERRISGLFFEKSLGQHLREGTGLSTANVQKGHNSVGNIISDVIFNTLTTLVQVIVTYGLLWWLSARIALIMTAVALVYMASSLVLNLLAEREGCEIDERERKASRYRNDRWNAIERCKNNGQTPNELGSIMGLYDSYYDAFIKLWSRVDPLFETRSTMLDLAGLGILVYGLVLAWHGDLTIGAVLPLTSWSRSFVTGLRQLSWSERRLQRSLPAIKSMREALFVPPDISDKADAIDLPGGSMPTVELRDVGFTYGQSSDEGDKPKPPILRGISLTIAPGERVAVMGPSGAGKTTLSRLLLRYFDPTSGAVLVNGRDLRDYRYESWIGAIGHIAQTPQVFDGTIRDNLVYGLSPEARAAVSDDDLWDVMKRLRIDFGSRLSDGLDTKVGRNGLKLSGGEAQRLLIGAAVIRQPRLMVIDEATSSLDSETEREVQQGLEAVLTEGSSALVIAHRLSTVRRLCTKFVVLRDVDSLAPEDSQIEAVASSFEDLYAISPTFRRLADAQGMTMCDLPAAAANRPAQA
jgi:ATP-binding cassette subfamily B protein